jgi:DNA-binding response OmpR family regulator
MRSNREYILVVDDGVDTADSFALLFRLWGFDALACYDGESALEAARACPPQVVLLDLAMPRMDGFRLARLLREEARCSETALIAVTGLSDAASHARAREATIEHYLLKPPDLDALRALLVWVTRRKCEPRRFQHSGPRWSNRDWVEAAGFDTGSSRVQERRLGIPPLGSIVCKEVSRCFASRSCCWPPP